MVGRLPPMVVVVAFLESFSCSCASSPRETEQTIAVVRKSRRDQVMHCLRASDRSERKNSTRKSCSWPTEFQCETDGGRPPPHRNGRQDASVTILAESMLLLPCLCAGRRGNGARRLCSPPGQTQARLLRRAVRCHEVWRCG